MRDASIRSSKATSARASARASARSHSAVSCGVWLRSQRTHVMQRLSQYTRDEGRWQMKGTAGARADWRTWTAAMIIVVVAFAAAGAVGALMQQRTTQKSLDSQTHKESLEDACSRMRELALEAEVSRERLEPHALQVYRRILEGVQALKEAQVHSHAIKMYLQDLERRLTEVK